jgi:hypothetical protein
MRTVEKVRSAPESRLSKQITSDNDAAANEEEREERNERNSVKKAARANGTGFPVPRMSNKQMETADDAVASKEEVEQRAEESHINMLARENGISQGAHQVRRKQ